MLLLLNYSKLFQTVISSPSLPRIIEWEQLLSDSLWKSWRVDGFAVALRQWGLNGCCRYNSDKNDVLGTYAAEIRIFGSFFRLCSYYFGIIWLFPAFLAKFRLKTENIHYTTENFCHFHPALHYTTENFCHFHPALGAVPSPAHPARGRRSPAVPRAYAPPLTRRATHPQPPLARRFWKHDC